MIAEMAQSNRSGELTRVIKVRKLSSFVLASTALKPRYTISNLNNSAHTILQGRQVVLRFSRL